MAKLPNYYKVSVDGLNVKLEPIYEELVEVVRCKDCKHYEDHKRNIYENCVRDDRLVPMKPDDFCSYGKKESGRMTVNEWRNKHRKCLFCNHCDTHRHFGLSSWCKAKAKLVHDDIPRPFCVLFQLKEKNNA